ncbi:MAG TPA: Xaa-Pro peptidase family protein [Vicinamibacterales bacterium]|nr:Xaa-Pro peptidase family protein [Vicinamibacterales bacterium]
MPEPARPDWSGRLQTLRETCRQLGVDTLVVSTPLNVKYLTGFAGSAGLLLASPSDVQLLVDGRYTGAVAAAIAAGEVANMAVAKVENRVDSSLGALLRAGNASRVGFEAAHVTVATLTSWQIAASGIQWQPTERLVERQRAVKDAQELAVLRRAAQSLSNVARALPSLVSRGRTEHEVARAIDLALEMAGFSEPAFPTIVASGPNSAHPHAHPSDRRLAGGDLVVLDFGGVLDGYCVDLTRMAAIGQVSPEARALFAAVQEAQTAAISTVRAGVTGAAVDAAARRVLEARGLAEAFLHSTGHGLGLEVHEAPRLSSERSGPAELLEAGMVCTIEPGAYLEGFAGVRLEDDVLVTPEGSEVLTDAPRDLLVV